MVRWHDLPLSPFLSHSLSHTFTPSLLGISNPWKTYVQCFSGGMPDSVGRGYVLRLILRRAIRFSKKINAQPNLMSSLVPVVIDLLGGFFTDLPAHAARVIEVLDREEALFRKTLVGVQLV